MALRSGQTPCMICGKRAPGHVIVVDRRERPLGRVCSSHSLNEIINHDSDHLTAKVIMVDPEELAW